MPTSMGTSPKGVIVRQIARKRLSQTQRGSLLRAYAEWMYDERGLAPKTRALYVSTAVRADRWLQANRGHGIFWAGEKDLKAFLFSLPPNARTRNVVRCALSCLGRFLVEWDIWKANIASGLPYLPEPRPIPKPHPEEAVLVMLAAARSLGLIYEMLLKLLLYSGLRRDEARLLEWSMIEEGRMYFKVKSRGGRTKERSLPLHHEIAEVLLRWRRECLDARWVFPSSRRIGQPVSYTHFGHMLDQVGEEAGIRTHPHRWRHTFGTGVARATGGNILLVQEALGHESPRTSAVYVKIEAQELREAIEKLDFSGTGFSS